MCRTPFIVSAGKIFGITTVVAAQPAQVIVVSNRHSLLFDSQCCLSPTRGGF